MPADPETQEVVPGVEHENLEGWIPKLDSETDLRTALEKAFDYRGDVTLTLDDGTRVEGFVSDPGPEAIQLWPVGESVPVAIEARRVRRVALNGRDPAARGRAEHAAPAPA